MSKQKFVFNGTTIDINGIDKTLKHILIPR